MEAARTVGRELPWEGRCTRELLHLSWPIALSMLSYSFMTLVDTLLVGRLGAGALAGVGLAGTLSFAILCFSIGLLRGVKTLISQAIGAGQRSEITAYLGAGLLLSLGMGVLTIGVSQGVALLLPRLCATAEAGEAGRVYLQIRAFGGPIALCYAALREVRYGQSDARSPMVATIIANVINVALAVLFVFVLRWGVAGAAWAALIAQHVEAGLLFFVQLREDSSVHRVRMEHVRALLHIGLPTGLQFVLEVGSFALLAVLISRLSAVEMAAHQIALQVIHFSFLPAFAVAEGVNVLTGQAVGADRDELLLKVARRGLLLASIYTGLCTLLLAVGARLLAEGFTADLAVVAVATRLLQVAAVFQVGDGANMIARAALRGAGDARYAAVVGVLTAWVATPPLTWLLGYRMGMGALGGWLGLCAEIIVGAGLVWHRLLRGGWATAAAAARADLRKAAEGREHGEGGGAVLPAGG